jgi:hypothetical protein
VNFNVQATNCGVAGYTMSNVADPEDPTSEATPKTPTSGPNTFWDGPVIGKSGGSIQIPFSLGCHTVYVRAWGNLGVGNGNANGAYGRICMGAANQVCKFAMGALSGL